MLEPQDTNLLQNFIRDEMWKLCRINNRLDFHSFIILPLIFILERTRTFIKQSRLFVSRTRSFTFNSPGRFIMNTYTPYYFLNSFNSFRLRTSIGAAKIQTYFSFFSRSAIWYDHTIILFTKNKLLISHSSHMNHKSLTPNQYSFI